MFNIIVQILYLLYLHEKIAKKLLLLKKIYIDDYKDLVIITLRKSICVDLPVKIYESPKDHIRFIVSYNEFLAEYKIKIEIFRLLNRT